MQTENFFEPHRQVTQQSTTAHRTIFFPNNDVKMICREGKVSAVSFVVSLLTQLFGVSEYGEKLALLLSESIFTSIYSLFLLYFIALVFILSIAFKSKDFQVSKLIVCFQQLLLTKFSFIRSPSEPAFSAMPSASVCSLPSPWTIDTNRSASTAPSSHSFTTPNT